MFLTAEPGYYSLLIPDVRPLIILQASKASTDITEEVRYPHVHTVPCSKM